MRVLLELIRIIVICAIVGGTLGYFLKNVYLEIGIDIEKYGWMGFIFIFILIFVFTETSCNLADGIKGRIEINYRK